MLEAWEKERNRLQKLVRPVIVVSGAEQLALRFDTYPAEWAAMPTGDYGIRGLSGETIYDDKKRVIGHQPEWFVIERKNDDLPNVAIGGKKGDDTGGERERVAKEVQRMRRFRWRGFIMEKWQCEIENGDYRQKVAPTSVLGTLLAYETRQNVHIDWAGSAQGAANYVEGLVYHYTRGLLGEIARGEMSAEDEAVVRAALGLE
jgi:hypothetical protein